MRQLLQFLNDADLRPEDAWMRDDPDVFARIQSQVLSGAPCFLLPSPDNPSVLCGLWHSLGVGEVWMVATNEFKDNWRDIYKLQRQLVAQFYEVLGLHRMHMTVDPSRPQDQKYAKLLGFEYDTPALRWSHDGRDMEFWLWPTNERGSDG